MFELYIASIDQTLIWPLLILLGVVIGIIGGLYGVGGFLLTPFLKVIFGLPYPVAVGCSLTIVLINSILTTFGHFKKGSVNIKLAAVLTLGAVPGTEMGVRINQFLREYSVSHGISILDSTLNFAFVILITFVIVSSIVKERTKEQLNNNGALLKFFKTGPFFNIGTDLRKPVSVWGFIIISFFIGITTGMLGIGGGILFFPALTYLFGISSFTAIGTAALERIFVTSFGSLRYIIEGNFNFLITLILFTGSFAGVQLGLKLAYRMGSDLVRRSFLIILLSGIIVVLYDIYLIYR